MNAGVSRWFQRWGWGLAVAACYFVFIGTGLNEPDEGRYAEIAREMAVVDGDWFTPHLNGIPHFQKPPLLYWLTALSLKVFGVHFWAARLPVVLAALGTLALTAWLARMLLGSGMRRAAVLVLASSAGFFGLARVLTPDMLLTFWITAAIACVVRRHRGGGAGWGWAFFIAMGLGFMTKGPMALVVPLCATLGLRWGTPRAEREQLPWLRGLALTLALGLSWFVAQSLARKDLFDYFTGNELLARFASAKHGRSKPWWFFIAVLPVAFLPWTAWLLTPARRLWQRWRQRVPVGPGAGLLLGWVGAPFVILSLSGSKLPTYILPLLPALSLGVVAWWRAQGLRKPPLLPVAAGMLALLVVLAGFRDYANPHLKQQAATGELARLVRSQPDFDKATLFAARVRAQGFTFATGRLLCVTEDEADVVLKPTPEQGARLFKNIAALEKAMAALPVAYGLARRGDVPKAFPAGRWRELGSQGDFVLLGRVPPGPETSRPILLKGGESARMNFRDFFSNRITRADIALATLPVSLVFIWLWQRFGIAGALLAATATLLLRIRLKPVPSDTIKAPLPADSRQLDETDPARRTIWSRFHARDAPPVIQLIKYSLSGFGSLLVHLFIWGLLARWVFPAFDSTLNPTLRAWNTTKSNLAGFLVGNLCAYWANVRWVFTPGRHSPLVEFFWFSVVGLTAFVAGLLAGPLIIHYHGIATSTAQALLFTTIFIVNFLCRKFLVFQK